MTKAVLPSAMLSLLPSWARKETRQTTYLGRGRDAHMSNPTGMRHQEGVKVCDCNILVPRSRQAILATKNFPVPLSLLGRSLCPHSLPSLVYQDDKGSLSSCFLMWPGSGRNCSLWYRITQFNVLGEATPFAEASSTGRYQRCILN